MDFGLTPEQELLRDTVRELVARTCPPETAKQWDDESTPPGVLQQALADWISSVCRSLRSSGAREPRRSSW